METEQKPQQTPFATINASAGQFVDGTLGVLVTLSPGALTVDAEGNPLPGLVLEPWQARRFAYFLLQLAEEQAKDVRAHKLMLGRLKFYNEAKCFGFVLNEGGEFFFHGRNVIGEVPRGGDLVDFWLDDDRRGGGRLEAVEVQVRTGVYNGR